MDSKSIRRQNLLLLKARAGSFAELERLTQGGVTASYMSQVRGGRGLGDEVARRIEDSLSLPHGWMDIPHQPTELAQPVDENLPRGSLLVRNEPAEFPLMGGGVAIPQLDVRGSMGSGAPLLERETVIDMIRVPETWVHENFPYITAAKNLKIITGFGDSMKPTFQHGDPLIVDTGVIAMDVDTVYVFAYQEELYIKRVQRLPDRSVKVISDNRAMYDPFTLDAKQRENVNVIGRVVCAVNMNKIS